MLLTALSALAIKGSTENVVPVILYSRQPVSSEIRKMWGELPGQQDAEKALASQDTVVSTLENKGYLVIKQDSIVIGIDKGLDFMVSPRRLRLLADAVKASGKDHVFHVEPGKNELSDQIMREVCTTMMTLPSSQGFDVQINPVLSVSATGKSAKRPITVFLPSHGSVSTSLTQHPFQQKVVAKNERISGDGVFDQGRKGYCVDWSPNVDLRRMIAVADKVFDATVEEASKNLEEAQFDLERDTMERYAKELGSHAPVGEMKWSETSPWLRDQLMSQFRGNYQALGFIDPDSAAIALAGSGGVKATLRYSYEFFVDQGGGKGFTMTMAIGH